MAELDILTQLEAISIIKENKTNVDYFIFDEFEIHINKIPPNTVQEWHMHMKIEEVIVMTEGELCLKWKENSNVNNEIIMKNSVIRVKKSIHTIENITNKWAEFIVFRMVPSGDIKREIIKNDKILIENQIICNGNI